MPYGNYYVYLHMVFARVRNRIRKTCRNRRNSPSDAENTGVHGPRPWIGADRTGKTAGQNLAWTRDEPVFVLGDPKPTL